MNVHTDHRVLLAYSISVFLFLSLIVAVMPALEMQRTPPLAGIKPLDDIAQRGRDLYLKEGCGTCHTQFVRDLPMDAPYGRGSVAGDFALEDPPLLGSQRTGPDLTNIGMRQPSETWHLIHLYNPRSVVPTSVMPGYPWYFAVKDEAETSDIELPLPPEFKPAGKTVVATEDAIALVRYLQSLHQVPLEQP